MSHNTFPLAMVSVGERVRLEHIRGRKKLSQRLAAMGLTPGVELRVLQNGGGPLLVCVRDSRIALGRGMAHHLLVSAVGVSGDRYRCCEDS